MIRPKRTIAVGIGDQGAVQLLDWVAALAHPGDAVHLVHAYEPSPAVPAASPSAATVSPLPVDNDDLIYAASARHATYAAAALRRKRPDLKVDEGIVRRSSARTLTAAAETADLIVVGIPHRPSSRAALSRLARRSRCPVLVIADQHPPVMPQHAPVTVLLRDLSNDEGAIEAGFEAAAERHGGLIALRAWQPPPDAGLTDPEALAYAEAEEQLAIDQFLASWAPRFPEVAVSSQLRAGDACSVVREHADDAALLVLGNGPVVDSPDPILDPVVDTALRVRHAPTLLIPSSSWSSQSWLDPMRAGRRSVN